MVIMFMINIFLVIMGMLMDDISVVVLATPILMPIVMHLEFQPHSFCGNNWRQYRPWVYYSTCCTRFSICLDDLVLHPLMR